ncbi:unnamed protein product [Coregonus sp. 'balchen']|nr:unnamed protein product [Coregonus sp. 'balchen']
MSLEHNEELSVEIARLRNQIEEITISSNFCLERFAGSDDDIRFFTRFASHAHLMAFWKQIEPATCKIIRVTRARSVAKTDEVPHTGNAMVLQPIDTFFLFINYLSLGLMQKDLAHRFKIHQSTVSHIINTWANFLYTVLGAVGIWLDEETVKSHMPEVFQGYTDTQIILDCTEIHCQTPSSLLLQSEVFSNYKSHCTFKGLIGMAPNGAVTFVSSLYEDAISDKEILKQSGIVAILNPSMAIMVDKGFLRWLGALQWRGGGGGQVSYLRSGGEQVELGGLGGGQGDRGLTHLRDRLGPRGGGRWGRAGEGWVVVVVVVGGGKRSEVTAGAVQTAEGGASRDREAAGIVASGGRFRGIQGKLVETLGLFGFGLALGLVDVVVLIGRVATFLPKGTGVIMALGSAIQTHIGVAIPHPSTSSPPHPHHPASPFPDLEVQTGHGSVADPPGLWSSQHHGPLQLRVKHTPMGRDVLQSWAAQPNPHPQA